MSSVNHEDVSLSVLDRSLKLVRVPRSRLNECMHAVVKTLWFREAGDPFFSLCGNALELSIFGEASLISSTFGPLASYSHGNDNDIIIDDNLWLALQVEQHSENWDESGARVKDISAPLAKEGISIMFLATRYSDFLICKEHRLPQVLAILQDNGFGFAAEPDANHSSSGRASPMLRKRTSSTTRSSSVTGSLVLTRSVTTSATSSPVRPGSSREPIFSSVESLSSNGDEERGRTRRIRTTTSGTLIDEEEAQANDLVPSESPPPDLPRSFPKSGDLIPSNGLNSDILASSLAILPDELVTVGLAVDYENVWREKLVRALFFCEDVLPPVEASSVLADHDDDLALEDEERRTSSPFSKDSNHSQGTHSPHRSASLLAASLAQSAISEKSHGGAQSTARPNTPASDRVSQRHPSLDTRNGKDRPVSTAEAPYPVPFLGFTQTVEGASLTADIRLLRALFSPSEEGSMVYAVGEGGLSGEWVGETVDKPLRSHARAVFEASNGGSWLSNGVDHFRVLLKCLQLDLSQFGLDKHGLVNAVADLLSDEGINLLYSSTFKTACISVSKRDLPKARRILQAHSS